MLRSGHVNRSPRLSTPSTRSLVWGNAHSAEGKDAGLLPNAQKILNTNRDGVTSIQRLDRVRR
jgi:hypothetical protein